MTSSPPSPVATLPESPETVAEPVATPAPVQDAPPRGRHGRPVRLPAPPPASASAGGGFDLLPEEADLMRHLSRWRPSIGVTAPASPPNAKPTNETGAQKDMPAPAESFSVLRVILAAAAVVTTGLIVVALVRGGL